MLTKTHLKDIFVVGSCILVFAVTVALTADKEHRHAEANRPAQGGTPPGGPPFAKIAHDLHVPATRVRNAFESVGPPSASPRQLPSEQQLSEHAQKLAVALNVPVDELRPVLEAYRPPAR